MCGCTYVETRACVRLDDMMISDDVTSKYKSFVSLSDLPKMGGTSTGVLTFVTAEHMQEADAEDAVELSTTGMTNSSLKVEPVCVHGLILHVHFNHGIARYLSYSVWPVFSI